MKPARWRLSLAVLACLAAAACSSSGAPAATSPAAPNTSTPNTSTPSTSAPDTPVSSAAGSDDAVQHYLDSVNALCDALLPKIIKVTNGGSFDIPLKEFFQQLPEHQKLRDGFDADLAKIPVPPAAKDKAAALAAYIRFANGLDASRLAAAKKGDAAYQKEIAVESDAANDPSIAARTAAGFSESCDAR